MGFNINKNLAQSSLASPYTAGDSTITVQTGDGAKFDAGPFVIALNNPPDFFLEVTGVSGDTLTVNTSGFDSSTPVNEAANIQVTEVITAGVLQSLLIPKAVESHTAVVGTTTELDFTAWLDPNCDVYEIEFENIVPSTTGLTLDLEFSTNGGSSYDVTANYSWSSFVWSFAGSALGGNTAQNNFAIFPYQGRTMVTGSYTVCGSLKLFNPGSTTVYKNLIGQMLGNDSATSAAAQRLDLSCWYTNTSAVNAFRIKISGGTFGGTVRVYKKTH